jgi:hypothetical protein
MCCNEYKNNLHEYSTGKLSELESHAIAKHLKSCEKCRRELEEIRELKSFLKPGIQDMLLPPMDLKSGIMKSINLRKYDAPHRNTLGEMANWGMSLVAAGLILLLVNIAPAGDLAQAHNDWNTRRENIREKLYQPISSINEGLDEFTNRITQLDGITGRMEREKKGGSSDEM